MLALTIFLLFKVNKKRVNCLFMQIQYASLLTHSITILQWNQLSKV